MWCGREHSNGNSSQKDRFWEEAQQCFLGDDISSSITIVLFQLLLDPIDAKTYTEGNNCKTRSHDNNLAVRASISKMSQISSSYSGPLFLSNFLLGGGFQDVYTTSKVDIPGLNVESFSGYITVDPELNRNLFFWFFPSTKVSRKQAPLLVYLNGGPGNSSLIGLFEEVGPIKVDNKGQVGRRQINWTDEFSVVFVDSPVGVGFSFSDPGGEVMTNNVVADNLYSFLTQFLQLYPDYQEQDLYLGGVSYAGKYVPALAYKVHRETNSPVKINLRGIYIFSGLCDPGSMLPHYSDLLLSLGLVTGKKGNEINDKINRAKKKHATGQHTETIIDIVDCVFVDMKDKLGYKELDNTLNTKSYNWVFAEFLNQPGIQSAIHVRPIEYVASAEKIIMDMAEDFLDGVTNELAFLMDKYKVLMCSGCLDLLVSVPMTEVLLNSLPWSGRENYLDAEKVKWVDDQGEVAGYVTKVNKFTRVVMRNAGHRGAIDQPAWTLDMMTKFVHDRDF